MFVDLQEDSPMQDELPRSHMLVVTSHMYSITSIWVMGTYLASLESCVVRH